MPARSTSKRCDRTTWKASPARMYSLARMTASMKCAGSGARTPFDATPPTAASMGRAGSAGDRGHRGGRIRRYQRLLARRGARLGLAPGDRGLALVNADDRARRHAHERVRRPLLGADHALEQEAVLGRAQLAERRHRGVEI